jgi:hypothetical protein
MMGLLRADLLKLRKRWLFWVLLAVLAVFVGLSAVIFLVLPSVAPGAIPDMPVFPRRDALLLGAQQAVGQTWFPLILAVVFLGGEVTTPIWATAITQEARRWMHLISKLVVCSLASWVAMILAIVGWTLVAVLFTDGEGLPAGTWVEMVWKSGLTQVTWTALGLGAVSLMRNMGIAIGTVLAFSLFEGAGALWEPYRNVSLTTASTALFGDLGTEISAGGFAMGDMMSMPLWQSLAVIAGWTVVGAALAITGLTIRDP